MVAMQIAAEPLVRQSLRQAFQSRAVICVKPTKKGRKVSYSTHYCTYVLHCIWHTHSMALLKSMLYMYVCNSYIQSTCMCSGLILSLSLNSPLSSCRLLLACPQMVDDSHPCYSMKYLRNKPIKELKGDEFLKLVQAEEDRLLEVKISIDRDLGPEKRYSL